MAARQYVHRKNKKADCADSEETSCDPGRDFWFVFPGGRKKSSDIDLLIEIKRKVSLLDIADLKLELEDKLRKKVDVVEYSVIKPLIRERVLSEEVPIL